MLVKIRSYGIGVHPKVRVRRRENRHTHTPTHTHTQRRPCAKGGRDWSDIAIRQGMPSKVGSQEKLGRIYEGFSPRVFRGNTALQTTAFQTSRLQNGKKDPFLLSPLHNEYAHLKSSLTAETLSWISLKATPLPPPLSTPNRNTSATVNLLGTYHSLS